MEDWRSTIYPTHTQLIEHMQQLGFEVDKNGMCYGLTHTAISAIHFGAEVFVF